VQERLGPFTCFTNCRADARPALLAAAGYINIHTHTYTHTYTSDALGVQERLGRVTCFTSTQVQILTQNLFFFLGPADALGVQERLGLFLMILLTFAWDGVRRRTAVEERVMLCV
jgi:hypothetical protein